MTALTPTALTPTPATPISRSAAAFTVYAALSLAWALPSAAATPTADTPSDTPVESAALRCSAISQLHSTLTVPSPQFGQLMGDIAGLFAQIHATQKNARTKGKLNATELKGKRDAALTEIIKGWPTNKAAIVRDAAICNAWRIALFSKLPEKPNDKEFHSAMLNTGAPPAEVPKADLDKWGALTPEAMLAWTAIKAPAK